MKRKPFYVILGLVALAFLVFSVYTAWTRFRPPYPVAVGTPIRHDDFLFTVTAIQRQTLSGGGASYHITVNVENQAKAVSYQWRDSIAYVRAFDPNGYGHDIFTQTNGSFTLPPGESRTAHLLFYVPPTMSSANLRFWDGIFMGDFLNGATYAKAIVPLEPYHPPIGT